MTRPRILVTRPREDASTWVQGLSSLGCEAIALPLIDIGEAPSTPALEAARAQPSQFDALMFVSANAARHFFCHTTAFQVSQWLKAALTTRCWAPGPGTARCLQALGIPAHCIDQPPADASQFDSESLWAVVGSQVHTGMRVCIVRGTDNDPQERGNGQGREWLRQQLAATGAEVQLVASYARQLPIWDDTTRGMAHHAASDGTWWLFSSAQAVANLQQLLPHQSWTQARAVATHPRIAQAVQAAGFGVLRECTPHLQAVAASIESRP